MTIISDCTRTLQVDIITQQAACSGILETRIIADHGAKTLRTALPDDENRITCIRIQYLKPLNIDISDGGSLSPSFTIMVSGDQIQIKGPGKGHVFCKAIETITRNILSHIDFSQTGNSMRNYTNMQLFKRQLRQQCGRRKVEITGL